MPNGRCSLFLLQTSEGGQMVPRGSGRLANRGRAVPVAKIGLAMPKGERLLPGLEELSAERENQTEGKGSYGQ